MSAYPFLLSVGGVGVYRISRLSPTKCLFLPGIFKKACPAASPKKIKNYTKRQFCDMDNMQLLYESNLPLIDKKVY